MFLVCGSNNAGQLLSVLPPLYDRCSVVVCFIGHPDGEFTLFLVSSLSLFPFFSHRTCEGQNIKYRTCSNVQDCPPEAADFRAQQCSAHADVRHQGQYHEWLPVDNDPDNPCALKCLAQGSGLLVELAPKVLDGTRCYTESLDMCISGACQIVGCDHELGSAAKEDNCGVCNGDGSSCRLVRGHYKSQHASGKTEDTVVVIPYRSRHVRLVLKGPDSLYIESKTLQGVKGELSLEVSGQQRLENTTLDYQKHPDKAVMRIAGPLGADFTVKVQYAGGGAADSVVQYIFYQPIVHRWQETDFFPCSVTCGGGYQLTSAECFDLRSERVVVDQYCHYYPENVKPKPKLRECNMDPCMASDGYKQIMPYDLYHPLPRWESSPWTACSASCGGGLQSRAVSCVEEDLQGVVTATEEWKCLYVPKAAVMQPCNAFHCPTWLAQDWSPCTVTCGQGLRYRVVLCIDHRGLHAGGCSSTTKPHIKEGCLVTVPCYRPLETLPVEAKPVWHKQAIGLEEDEEEEEEVRASEEPTFVPGPWGPCSRSCGSGAQARSVRCQVLLSFSQTVADLPDDECEGPEPARGRRCYRAPCTGGGAWDEDEDEEEEEEEEEAREELHDWEYDGFSECSESCGGGLQEAVVICLNKQTREPAEQRVCVSSRRPPQLLQDCNTQPCPPRWQTGEWSSCSATCGVGLKTRAVACTHRPARGSNATRAVRDEECPPSKPVPVQACNRFDCPPSWDPLEWGKCSRSCGGGGVQLREVVCRQHLADGSALPLHESFCPSTVPGSQQPCASQDCPPQWLTGVWSQCSVSCGRGLQRVEPVCVRQRENGSVQTLSQDACSTAPRPASVRTCTMRPCDETTRLEMAKPEPAILAQSRVYIQRRKGKKLQLVVGGYAYLLPWTSVVLRCPTRRFGKGRVQWLKDGRPLAALPHLSLTAPGHLKIHQLDAADVGVYTCVAGTARESFVLKVIGSKQKPSWPGAGGAWLHGIGGGLGRKSGGPDAPEIPQELRDAFGRYDDVARRLLDFKAPATPSGERNENGSAPVDVATTGGGLSDPALLVAETKTLDAVVQRLSEGLRGPQEELLVARLLGEMSAAREDTNESTLHPLERPEASPSTGGSLPYRPGGRAHTPRPRAPVFLQRPGAAGATGASEVSVQAGAPVTLQGRVDSLEVRCEAAGHPAPSLSWTRDGRVISADARVELLPTGSLRLLSPGREDEGVYTCTASNRHGTTSAATRLHISGPGCLHGNGGTATDGSICPDSTDNSKASELCHGQACPLRWRVDGWSTCSASCGGGTQGRRVTCVGGPDRRPLELESQRCSSAGRTPPADTKPCSLQPCVGWTSGHWGACHGHCVGPSLATQRRTVHCQDSNGTRVPSRLCPGSQRPSSLRNCSSEACALHWRTGPWTQCTATCGRHGFQSRHVTCADPKTGRGSRDHQCSWRPRPPGWQRCNLTSCGRAEECRDSTRYCEKVHQLQLCVLPQFKTRCCQSCRDTPGDTPGDTP
ncbi:ADAMTS-like protein 1 isoform X1 [Gadus morhua]|uniref:ADAMTS-like protein 1 isoform X1 n=1 Tax=Gadus morhua TaxID=8049 RepID=UPI0011B5AC08|nr:ADAMTS-like protein 1 isoform X1 [Gadus morhua]